MTWLVPLPGGLKRQKLPKGDFVQMDRPFDQKIKNDQVNLVTFKVAKLTKKPLKVPKTLYIYTYI